MLLRRRVEYFDPDEAARRILVANPGTGQTQANGAAWLEGRRLLDRAIDERLDFAFETTLGGRTITARLERAAVRGIEVRVWYVGLSSPELHVARVRARVAKGGHDIPEPRIRERYDASRLNLIRLLPRLSEVWVYDNSVEAVPAAGEAPEPRLVLHLRRGAIVGPRDLSLTPEWAKAIVAAAMKA
jgi:predicted ABC-type ATPase